MINLTYKQIKDWTHLMFTPKIDYEWIRNSNIPETMDNTDIGVDLIKSLAQVIKDQNLFIVSNAIGDFDLYEEVLHVPDTVWMNIATNQVKRVQKIESDYSLEQKQDILDHSSRTYNYVIHNKPISVLNDKLWGNWRRGSDIHPNLGLTDFNIIPGSELMPFDRLQNNTEFKKRLLYKNEVLDPLPLSPAFQYNYDLFNAWFGGVAHWWLWYRKKFYRLLSIDYNFHINQIWYWFFGQGQRHPHPGIKEDWFFDFNYTLDGWDWQTNILNTYNWIKRPGTDRAMGTKNMTRISQDMYFGETVTKQEVPKFYDLYNFGKFRRSEDKLRRAVLDFYNPILYKDSDVNLVEIKRSAREKIQEEWINLNSPDFDLYYAQYKDDAEKLHKEITDLSFRYKELSKELKDLEYTAMYTESFFKNIPIWFEFYEDLAEKQFQDFIINLDYLLYIDVLFNKIGSGAIIGIISGLFKILHEVWLWFMYFGPYTISIFCLEGEFVVFLLFIWFVTWYTFKFESIYTNLLEKDSGGSGDKATEEYINPLMWVENYKHIPVHPFFIRWFDFYDYVHKKVIDCNGHEAGIASFVMVFWCNRNFYHRDFWDPDFLTRKERRAHYQKDLSGSRYETKEHKQTLMDFELFYQKYFQNPVQEYISNIKYGSDYGVPYNIEYIEKEYKHYFYCEYLRARHLLPYESMHSLFMFFPKSEIHRFPFLRVRDQYFRFGQSQCWPSREYSYNDKSGLQELYDTQVILYGPKIAYLNLLYNGHFTQYFTTKEVEFARQASFNDNPDKPKISPEFWDEATYAKLKLHKKSPWFIDETKSKNYDTIINETKNLFKDILSIRQTKNQLLYMEQDISLTWIARDSPEVTIINQTIEEYPVSLWYITAEQFMDKDAFSEVLSNECDWEDNFELWPFCRFLPQENGSLFKWLTDGGVCHPSFSGNGILFENENLESWRTTNGLYGCLPGTSLYWKKKGTRLSKLHVYRSTYGGELYASNRFMDLEWNRESDGFREGFLFSFAKNIEGLIWGNPNKFMSFDHSTNPHNYASLTLGSLYRTTDSVKLEGVDNYEPKPLDYQTVMHDRAYKDKIASLSRLESLGPEKAFLPFSNIREYRYGIDKEVFENMNDFLPSTPQVERENAYVYRPNSSESTLILYDAAVPYQILFQDPASPMMEGIIALHHDVFVFLIVIACSVSYLLYRILSVFGYNKEVNKPITHHTDLEIFWTVVPCLILIVIAIPSFSLLYAMDEIINPALTFKAIGHQWYWSYEFSDQAFSYEEVFSFDSYMLPFEDLTVGSLRLLEVDERVALPLNVHIRLLVTSTDVLHCWTVPSLGVKLDACPGRLNQAGIYINRPGVFYGQCSEICGINHGFMPIVIQGVPLSDFDFWVTVKTFENDDIDASFSELMSRSFTSN